MKKLLTSVAVTLLLGVCTVLIVHAQRQPPIKQAQAVRVPSPADAVALAWADCITLPPEDQPFQSYFFTLDRSKDFHGAFDYVLNTCVSHASTLYRSDRVADGWLIRVDRRRLWPKQDDFVVLDAELGKLAQIEPYFHTTGEIVVKAKKTEVKNVLVEVPRYQHENGRWYTQKWVPKEVVIQDEVVKFGSEFSLHLLGEGGDATPVAGLASATATPGFDINPNPIMRADWFMFLVSSTAKEDNGKYYTFRRIENSKGGQTAEELWVEGLGIDYADVQARRADQRIAKWRSDITGKPRAIEYLFAPSARPSVGPTGIALTRDYFNGKINATEHALKNLLHYNFDGTEAMGFLPNGMMSFVLLDGNGDLVDKAPGELVSDRTVPAPHTTVLQAPISCFRCHGPTDMWMDARNDVYALAKSPMGLNIFDDESSKDDPDGTLDRLAGLYAGEMSEFLRINRNTHAKATFIVTGGMTIPTVSQKIGEVYNRYRFGAITPQIACLELGWVVNENEAAAYLNEVLPLLPKNRHGIHPESVTIGTLRAWTPANQLYVNRDDWEQEYADAMLRVQTELIRTKALGN